MFCIAVLACSAAPARAEGINFLTDPGHWRLVASPYAAHFRYSPEHKNVYALGLERQLDNGYLAGAAYFRNSFGQPSAYAYIGERYVGLLGQPQLIAQWSAGVLYGYKGKYKTKVPFNHDGFAPGALISTGWQFNKDFSAEVHLLGDAGVMFEFSYTLH